VAHVLAHCDFFKNNVRFSNTNRDMVESMSASAERIRHYELIYGKDEVEKFLDAVLAIQEHVDPGLFSSKLRWKEHYESEESARIVTDNVGPYDDLWGLDPVEREKKEAERAAAQKPRKFPPEPEKDVLLFIQEYGHY